MLIRFGLVVSLILAAGQSINFFSLKEDIEIGSESAKEAEQSLSLVPNTSLPNRYLSTIGRRVTQNRSIPSLNYRFRIVNSKDINSVGFPGGAVYISRGLLEIAASDDEVAAMVAHEVSHIASRHGTAQLSRQLWAQAPSAIAAGVPASQVWRDEMTKLGIALGIDAAFLRYSRDQEFEASLMAVRLINEARYDPNAFRTVLEKINEAQSTDPSRAPAFVFNHPQSQMSSPEITEVIEQLATPAIHARASADFQTFRSALLKLSPPSTKSPPLAEADSASGTLSMVFTHAMDYYQLAYPTGWQVTRNTPDGAIIAPVDGVQSSRNGNDVTHGVMFDLFDISLPDRSLTLEQATNRLLAFLRQRNQSPADPRFVDREGKTWLRIVPGAQAQLLISDEPGLRTVMIGRPDGSSQTEVAWVVTRLYYQTLFYMVFVAPEDEFPTYQPVFEQMIRSVRFR
ncbi:MAG TPA: M48 family metalloprotease [Terriglobia bacterium]|nr:M48 family metalloprotease [Terriglobia bacterium]